MQNKNILFIGKYPPIQGGVSALTHHMVHSLAKAGNHVYVVTNAGEVEYNFRQLWWGDDAGKLEATYANGFVKVFFTSEDRTGFSHIPYGEAYAERLFGLAQEIMDKHPIELIYSYYYQPYGFVAALLAKINNIPNIVMHAGSDVGRLSYHPDFERVSRWVVKNSRYLITKGAAADRIFELGGRAHQLMELEELPEFSPLPEYYQEQPEKLALEEITPLLESWYVQYGMNEELMRRVVRLAQKPLDEALPTIGIYGKAGRDKGSYALVSTLTQLAEKGIKFNFLIAATGWKQNLEHLYREILASDALSKCTWILPALAPWRIPQFIARCDLVCFLENRFPISFHTPRVPREVLKIGSCLICSDEAAAGSLYDWLEPGKDFVPIADPEDINAMTATLEEILQDEGKRHTIAESGKQALLKHSSR